MGVEIFVLDSKQNCKKAQLLIVSDTEWTSGVFVQGHQRLNVGIVIGTEISDILSAAAFSAVTSVVTSVFSGIITLQRRMPEEDASYHWRTVSSWTIASTGGGVGGSENITAYPEPETAEYRAGVTGDAAAYVGGVAHLRIGTS